MARKRIGSTPVLAGLVVVGLLIVGAEQAKAQQGYVYTTIDPPGSVWTQATGINAAGQIVGWWESR
jgi:hypothetical protein